MDGNNPGYAKRVGLYEGTIANGNGGKVVATFPLQSYGRIVGSLSCDKVLTVTVFQGPSEAHPGDAKDTAWSSTGDANFGAGDFFSHLIRVPEGYGTIWLENNSGEAATYRLAVGLTKGA